MAKIPTIADYTEVGYRYVMATFGNDEGNSFCVVDDYGNLVPVEPWNTMTDGYSAFYAPEFGTHGKYTQQFETVH